MFRHRHFTSILCVLIILISCNQIDDVVYKNEEAPIDKKVDDLLSRMTLEEKFWQLFMIPGDLARIRQTLKTGYLVSKLLPKVRWLMKQKNLD